MTATVFMVLALDALPDDDPVVIADNEAAKTVYPAVDWRAVAKASVACIEVLGTTPGFEEWCDFGEQLQLDGDDLMAYMSLHSEPVDYTPAHSSFDGVASIVNGRHRIALFRLARVTRVAVMDIDEMDRTRNEKGMTVQLAD